jgi:hypothetical protein
LVLVQFSKECGLDVDQRLACFRCNRLVGLQTAVTSNVEHCVTVFYEDAADEQAAMAVGRVFFSANQDHTEGSNTGLKAGDGCLEMFVVAESAIEDSAFGVVVIRVRRAAA